MASIKPKEDAPLEEIQAAKEVLNFSLIAVKNYGLYPQSHTICRQSVEKACGRLQAFINRYNKLRIDIERDRILFKGHVVHLDPPGGDCLAFPLFRDGIKWLSFEKGLEPIEIQEFLKILHKYNHSQDEAEGDFVTALWESDFPSIQYKAVDIHWESEPLLDLSSLRTGKDGPVCVEDDEEEQENSITIALEGIENIPWKLTPEEIDKLREIVLEEERRETTQDLLDLVLILIDDQSNQKELKEVLEFLEGQFQDTLEQGDFGFAYNFLVELHRKIKTYSSQRPWALPVLYTYLKRISSPQILGCLSKVLPTLDELDLAKIKLLRQFLILLPSRAIFALAHLLSQIRSQPLQSQLMQVITTLAKRDLNPLEQLLDSAEEFIVQKLLNVLGDIKGEKSTQLLLGKTHHASEKVRKQAVIKLLTWDRHFLEQLFPLIEDPSQSIRKLILDQLGQEKNSSAEAFLLDYLQQGQFKVRDHSHLIACYKALGRCGSSKSIPFLRTLLFQRGWTFDFGRSIHRRGAVMALVALGTEEAIALLHRASRSLLPSIRFAYRKAMEVK